MTTKKKLEAGNEIDSQCLKCKDVTNHTIIAMDGDTVAKVECNVCKARHKYRAPKPEKKAAAKKKTTGRAAAAASAKQTKAEARFDALVADRNPAKAKAYAMTETFKEGDLIDHSTFGLGVIIGTQMPNRIEVLFRQESKVLICVLPPLKLKR